MVKDTQGDQPASAEQKELEKHVKEMLGTPPVDPNKEVEEEKPPEKTLVIPPNKDIEEPLGPPPLGDITNLGAAESMNSSLEINPTETVEASKTDMAQVTPSVEPPEEQAGVMSSEIKKPKSGKVKRFFKAIFGTSKGRWTSFIIFVIVSFALVLTPTSRYFLLNTVGVRSSASITVLDGSTQLPLRNVKVKLANVSGQTDENGEVKLTKIELGQTELVIEKRAFATINQPITVGWGSNPLGKFSLKAVGAQYTFVIKDWLTGKPIEKAEATRGEASAFSDEQGKLLLTIDSSEVKDNMTITVKANDYRDEQAALDVDSKQAQTVQMVVNRKHVFISNRSGKYDIYSVYADGKNEKLVLAATGVERDDMVLVQHPTDAVAALVSTRVNVRNSDGFLLSTLTIFNLNDSSTFGVGQSEKLQIIGWVGTRLLYIQVAAGTSATDPGRFRLLSFDYKTAEKTEIARSNSFNDIALIGSSLYYAPSSSFQKDPKTGFIKSNADGTLKKTLFDKEVWNMFRVNYDTLNLMVGQTWYEYKIGSSNPVKLNESPANPKNRLYINNQDNTHALWVDQRDGKGVLLDYDIQKATDKILQTKSGLVYPVHWLTDSLFIYRIHTDTETADYVMSIDGKTAHKIKDVYNSGGIDRWYYY